MTPAEIEDAVCAAIVALDKDVAARMAKLQLLGYQFKFWENVRPATGVVWVTPFYPGGRRAELTDDIKHLADIVLRLWNVHVRTNNGWPEAVHVAQG